MQNREIRYDLEQPKKFGTLYNRCDRPCRRLLMYIYKGNAYYLNPSIFKSNSSPFPVADVQFMEDKGFCVNTYLDKVGFRRIRRVLDKPVTFESGSTYVFDTWQDDLTKFYIPIEWIEAVEEYVDNFPS